MYKRQPVNVFDFLSRFKKEPDKINLGRHVVVVGGGNTAMDAARAAKRVKGVETVSLVYRRNRKYMPADEEELELALEDGVEFRELLAPVGVKDGVLTCHEMELGAPDATGRRTPVDTGRVVEVPACTVITAVGEKVDTALYLSLIHIFQHGQRRGLRAGPPEVSEGHPHRSGPVSYTHLWTSCGGTYNVETVQKRKKQCHL